MPDHPEELRQIVCPLGVECSLTVTHKIETGFLVKCKGAKICPERFWFASDTYCRLLMRNDNDGENAN